ncbi:unnamed protein product [Symbiodinium sp. CCMP2456]|nr:unnamed protein product [Symbiodinium sp. CCMP2456]
MEVLLKDTKGVSPETIISIRAGSTRRQVPVSLADKPFKFPCQLSECGAIKVDFMTVTASARAILRPEGEQDVQLKMVKKSSSEEAVPAEEAEVSLLVRSSSGEGASTAVSPEERAAKKRGLASATEEYLSKHGVLTFIQGVLQGVIRDRPEDPYKYVADQFASASVSKKAPTLEEMRQTARDALLQGAKSGKLLEVLRESTPKASSPKADGAEVEASVDELRQLARDALLRGAQSGKLFDVLAESSAKKEQANKKADEDVDKLRLQARDLLLEGAQNGKLLEVLQGTPPQQESAESSNDVDKLRQQEGAKSGKLFDVLAQTPKQAVREDEAAEIDALRQQARDLLLEGAQSGKLLEVLQGTPLQESAESSDDVDKLRQQAREALLEGAKSGKLFDVLASKQAQEDAAEEGSKPEGKETEGAEIDALRQQARDLLLEGAQSGKLLEVLQGTPLQESAESSDSSDDVDKLRQQAREALLEGAKSGKLFEVLSTNSDQTEQLTSQPANKPSSEDDMDDLRRQAREALLLGAQSGKLMELLAKNSEQKAASKRGSGIGSTNPDELELLRQQAREALIQGAQSGRLLEVLAKPDEADEMFQLKKKLCEAIAGSMETGELTEALREARDLRTQEIGDALRDGAESGKILEVLAEKVAGTGGEDAKPLEMTQKPEEVAQKLLETSEALKATPEAERATAVDLALQLKLLQDQKRTMAAEKECLEDLLKELELKNSVLRSRSRSSSKEEAA